MESNRRFPSVSEAELRTDSLALAGALPVFHGLAVMLRRQHRMNKTLLSHSIPMTIFFWTDSSFVAISGIYGLRRKHG
jgi:hypothetical protein